jgi:hypothetical protein
MHDKTGDKTGTGTVSRKYKTVTGSISSEASSSLVSERGLSL